MENISNIKNYSRADQQPPNQSKYSPRQQQLLSCSQREALLPYEQSFLTKSENAESKSMDARVSAQPIPDSLISSKYSVLDEADMTLVQNQALATYLKSASPSACKNWLETYGHSCCAILSDTNTTLGTGYLIAPDVILTSKHILMPLLRSEARLQSISACFDDNPHSDRKIPFLYALEDGAQGDSKFDYVIIRLSKSVEMTPIPLLTEQPLGTSVVLHYPQGQEKQVSMGTFAGVSEYYQFESVYSSLTHHSSSGSSLGRASDGIIGWHTAYVKDGLRRGELFGSVKLNKPDSLLAKLLTNPWMLTSLVIYLKKLLIKH